MGRFTIVDKPYDVAAATKSPVNVTHEIFRPYNAQDKTLEVSLNGVDWTTSKRAFTFYDHARVFVSLFEPQGGPKAGGTEIIGGIYDWCIVREGEESVFGARFTFVIATGEERPILHHHSSLLPEVE